MNVLECKTEECNETVTCEEEVTAVTCSLCCATIGLRAENGSN